MSHGLFVATCGLPQVGVPEGFSLVAAQGLLVAGMGSLVVIRVLSCPMACRISVPYRG